MAAGAYVRLVATTASADGSRIEIIGATPRVKAAGAGSPVVLIHAGFADSGMWDHLWADLVPIARAVRYGLRGFGCSSLPPGNFAHHHGLRVLLDALQIDHAVIVGASMGGEVALAFAPTCPERVGGLVLLNTLARMEQSSLALRRDWRAVRDAMERGDVEGALEIEV